MLKSTPYISGQAVCAGIFDASSVVLLFKIVFILSTLL